MGPLSGGTIVRNIVSRGMVGAALLLASVGEARAQRAAENAVAEAEDAFGTVVGSEAIGLYTSSNARGFNPGQAGNLRIEGLYFDQAGGPNNRIIRGSTIRVGISAQGYTFPAPTGVVDYALRLPGDQTVVSVLTGVSSLIDRADLAKSFVEIDAQTPVIAGKLGLGVGFSFTRNGAFGPAMGDTNYAGSVLAQWTPNDSISLIPFWSGSKVSAVDGDRPRVILGENSPPRFIQQDLFSPKWLYFGFEQYNYGFIGNFALPNDWRLRTGVFRSANDNPSDTFTAFLFNTTPQGDGDYAIEKTPPRYTRSTSGEVLLTRVFAEGARRHTVIATTRARLRDATFGGGHMLRFGRVNLRAFPDMPEPAFTPVQTTATRTRQITGGIAYEGVWRDVGQLNVGIQKSAYERSLTRLGTAAVKSTRTPLLYNIGAAATLTDRLALFAGHTRGLEELGNAPGNAVNRDEAPAAELTSQIDGGVRYRIGKGVQLVAAAFLIDKPYFGLDQTNFFRELGETRHSGFEFSVAGPVTDELTVVAGAVLLRPHTTSTTAAGTTHLSVVGPTPRLGRVNLQYRPHALRGVIFDAKVEAVSSRYLTVSNAHSIGAAVTFDAGVRYNTTIAGVPVRFRIQGTNLTDTFSLNPSISGQITAFDGRRYEATIAADF